jgi:hypothetical protein
MAGRSRAAWIVFVGGPFDGERSVLWSGTAHGVVRRYTLSGAAGMRVPHEYTFTRGWRGSCGPCPRSPSCCRPTHRPERSARGGEAVRLRPDRVEVRAP